MKTSIKKQSMYMLTALAATSILGLVFWKIIIEGYSELEVGKLSSVISFGMLVATFITSGTISGIYANSYANQHQYRIIIASKALSSGIITTIITGVSGLMLTVFNNFEFLKNPANLTTVALFAGLTAYSLVLDAGLTANISAGLTLFRYVAQSVIKIVVALIIIIYVSSVSGVFNGIISSLLSLVLSVGYIMWRYFKKDTLVKPEFKFNNWGKHQILSSGFIVLPLSLPLIINIVSTPTDSALFYISWLFGALAYLIAPTIAGAMLSRIDDTDVDSFTNNIKSLKQTLKAILIITTIAFTGFIIVGKPVILFFGKNYDEAYNILCIIGAISIFNGITQTIISYMKTTGYIKQVYWLPWIPFAMVSTYMFIALFVDIFTLQNMALIWLAAEIMLTVIISIVIFNKKKNFNTASG